MHSFLRAIGFSNIQTRTQLNELFQGVMRNPTTKKLSKEINKVKKVEASLDYAKNMGITIRGEYDENGSFHLDHYFPYYKGNAAFVKEDVVINRRIDTESYTGMCDDTRLGVSLIFYIQNAMDFMNTKSIKTGDSTILSVQLSALSVEGKIFLGVEKDETQRKNSKYDTIKRNQLIIEAKMGNQEAIDSLTIDDIDLYALISRRIKYEDLYSIVETTFVPYGSESDNYSMIGTILDVLTVENHVTKEKVYQLLVECNDILFGICINKTDLFGEPKVGRRFKGNVWLQGAINFEL